MNEPIHEQLSALMDGELDGDQTRFVLARAQRDPDVARRWARYQFAAQVLRREHPVLLREGFADSVMGAITAPTLTVRPRMAHRVLRWGAGGAIAASVAVAALVVTRPAGESPTASPQPAFARATPVTAGPSIAVAPASATTTTFGPTEVRPPLLAPNVPLDAAPASYGMETLLVPSFDPRAGANARHAQQSASAAPYVLLIAPADASAPRNR